MIKTLRPESPEELFNLRHASLRNAIERIFGVIKKKFMILATLTEYSIDTQTQLVPAIVGLYNFIRQYEGIEGGDEDEGDENDTGNIEPII